MELTDNPIYYYKDGVLGPLGSITEKEAYKYSKNSCKKCNGRGVGQWSFDNGTGGVAWNLACTCVVKNYEKANKEIESIV